MIEKKQQLLLLEFLWNYAHGNKRLSRKDIINKPILSNDTDFFRHIKVLIEFGYVENDGGGSYCLTKNGWAFANITAMQPNTDKKFRNIAHEITWLP